MTDQRLPNDLAGSLRSFERLAGGDDWALPPRLYALITHAIEGVSSGAAQVYDVLAEGVQSDTVEDLLTRAEIPPEASGLVLVRHDGDVRTIACARKDGRVGVLTRQRGGDAALIVDEDAAGHTDVAALRAAVTPEVGD